MPQTGDEVVSCQRKYRHGRACQAALYRCVPAPKIGDSTHRWWRSAPGCWDVVLYWSWYRHCRIFPAVSHNRCAQRIMDTMSSAPKHYVFQIAEDIKNADIVIRPNMKNIGSTWYGINLIEAILRDERPARRCRNQTIDRLEIKKGGLKDQWRGKWTRSPVAWKSSIRLDELLEISKLG